MKEEIFKYLVLKWEDLVKYLPTCYQINLDKILDDYNEGRALEGKGINKYFVINRDEFPQFNDNPQAFIEFMQLNSTEEAIRIFMESYGNN